MPRTHRACWSDVIDPERSSPAGKMQKVDEWLAWNGHPSFPVGIGRAPRTRSIKSRGRFGHYAVPPQANQTRRSLVLSLPIGASSTSQKIPVGQYRRCRHTENRARVDGYVFPVICSQFPC
jgi:hypothetical protein